MNNPCDLGGRAVAVLLLLVGWSVVGGGVTVTAQAAEPVPPPEPPYVRVPEKAAWTVEIQAAGGATEAKATEAGGKVAVPTLKVECVKYDATKRDLFVYPDGSRVEVWYYGKYRLIPTRDQKHVVAIDPAISPEEKLIRESIYSEGYLAVGWMESGDYRGTRKKEGELCYYFQRAATDASPEMEAWISVSYSRPVEAVFQRTRYRFDYQPAPSGPLRMPPAYAEELERVPGVKK